MGKIGEKTYSASHMAKLAGEEFHAVMYNQPMPDVTPQQAEQPSIDQVIASAARSMSQDVTKGIDR